MSNSQEKRHLRLVVDNEPGYRLKTIEQLTVDRIQRRHLEQIDQIEKINKQLEGSLRKSFRKKGLAAALIVAAVSGIYISQYHPWNKPKTFILLQNDLNRDQVPDAYILQENGRKVPLFGVRQNNETIAYRSAEYMKGISDNIIDYQSIEDKLNEE